MKWIDLPPVWLVGFLLLGATMPRVGEVFYKQALMGQCFVGVGLLFMALAVVQMRRSQTTVIPRRTADHLVTRGIFTQTRNPIYLGDTFVLVGALLYWEVQLLAFVLVPAFMWVITIRFIKAEEAMLQARFGEDFTQYCAAVRRWL